MVGDYMASLHEPYNTSADKKGKKRPLDGLPSTGILKIAGVPGGKP